MDDDTLIRPMTRPRALDPTERSTLLPGPNTAYRASGTVDKEVSRLVLILGKEGFGVGKTAYWSFQYVHLGTGEFSHTPDGHAFRYVFADLQPKLITVHGRDLLRIYDGIALRLVPWIRQTDRDFRAIDDGTGTEPVITRIQVEDWQRVEV